MLLMLMKRFSIMALDVRVSRSNLFLVESYNNTHWDKTMAHLISPFKSCKLPFANMLGKKVLIFLTIKIEKIKEQFSCK
jgi:hypothetical protein